MMKEIRIDVPLLGTVAALVIGLACMCAHGHDKPEARWRVFYMHNRRWFDASGLLVSVAALLSGVLVACIGRAVGHQGMVVCGSVAAGMGGCWIIASLAGRD